MEAEIVRKTMQSLPQTKLKQDSTIFSKDEPKPAFIDAELEPFYNATDLSITYVFECCLTLKPLKGIDINDMQVEFWYKEFLRMGWKKFHFDKQFEAVKRAKLYNRIDLENWLDTEIMYNEIDLETTVRRRIDFMIHQAKQLKKTEVRLSEAEEKYIKAAEYKKITFELDQKRYVIMEEAAQKFRKEYLKQLSGLKSKIAEMSLPERTRVLDKAIDAGKIKCEKSGFEYQAILHNLEDFADKIYENNKN